MSTYINTQTFEYPIHIGDIQLVFPHATKHNVPEIYQQVKETPVPKFTQGSQVAYEQAPVFENGEWVRVWAVKDLTLDEIAANEEMAKIFDVNNMYNEESDLDAPGSEPDVIG